MISIIVPVYNVENYLYVSLNSILKQTYDDFEVICIDDDSTDSSLEILKYFSQKDSRIKIVKNEINKGLDFCKKIGFERAQGDFIYFFDGKRWLNSDTFEHLVENMEKNSLNLLLFKNTVFNMDSKNFEDDIFHNVNFINNLDSKVFNWDDLDDVSIFLIQEVPLDKFYLKSFLIENNIIFDENFFKNAFRAAKNISFLNKSFCNIFKKNGSNREELEFLTCFKNLINEFLPIIPWEDNGFIKIINKDYFVLFKLINSIEGVLLKNNLFNYFKNIFFKFKIINFKNYLKNISIENKKDFYDKIKQEFMAMRLTSKELNDLPFELYKFYITVLNYGYEKFVKFNQQSKRKHKYICKQELTPEINNFDKIGINTQERKESIIVSLTSFPERLFDIHFCLYSLLNQTLKPDKLILCLVREEFPNGENDIPQQVLNLKKNGLMIKWCDNFKSFTKLIPVLKEYPNDYIVTVDDDIFYPEDLIETIWNTYKKYPNTIISSRTRVMQITQDNQIDEYKTWDLAREFVDSSFLNFITGVGGTLYFPNALSSIVFEKNIFEKLCPTGDDIWFWAMAVLNKTKITGNLKQHNILNYVNISRELGIDDGHTLWDSNQYQNDVQLKKVLEYFPQILRIIHEG